VGKATKVIGATQDITARKITEEELYKSNERFDIMMMATNELLWDWDIKANRIHRSQTGVRKVYGLENDLSLQKIEQWLERVHPDDRPRLDHIFSSLEKASHHQTFEAEYRFQKGNGEYAFFYNRGILLKDKDQKPLRLIGASQDISERKRLEKELLKTELEYKKAINQATVDSQEQERGEIGKELHDNVNQVLTTTKLYLELALANEDLVHELIKKSSKNISTVINEIRQLSRSLMDPSLGDLGIIDSINDLIGNINLTRKVHITLDIAEEIEDLLNKAQKLTMFRIIQESLNNVIKHAKAKSVSIQITHQNNIAELIVADDGAGFIQESTRKGAGLKNITNRVYLINGTFFLDSEPDKGCRIKINFPINNS
jgi:PAS domain S-box-containing protein